MNKSQLIEHQGRQILFCDFSHCTSDDDALARIDQARVLVHAQARNSVYSLIDITDSRFNTRIVQACRQLAADNVPYVVATAIVGVNDMKAMILKGVSRITGRNFHFAKTGQEAKDWLVAQQSSHQQLAS